VRASARHQEDLRRIRLDLAALERLDILDSSHPARRASFEWLSEELERHTRMQKSINLTLSALSNDGVLANVVEAAKLWAENNPGWITIPGGSENQ